MSWNDRQSLIRTRSPGKFLAACRSHLRSGGLTVFQQQAPSWFGTIGQAARVRDDPGGPGGSSRAGRREPPRLFIEHQVGDRVRTHSQGAWEIIGRELADDPGSAGLRSGRWLTGDHA